MQCIKCGAHFDYNASPGGVYFGRPRSTVDGIVMTVQKYHFCDPCSDDLEEHFYCYEKARKLP